MRGPTNQVGTSVVSRQIAVNGYTSHALGWGLEFELAEFERIAESSGSIVHCPGTAENPGNPGESMQHKRLISEERRYEFARYREADGWKRKYWKHLSDPG